MKTLNFQKSIVATLLAFAMVFGSVSTTAMTAQAATYTVGNQSLAINEGMSTLTVNGNETVQLTRALVTKDGGIDANTGIVYLLWMSNSLYAYSYELQKSTGVQLVLVDTGIVSLTTNGNAVTGYDISSGHKNLLTLDEMKTKLGMSSSGTSTGTTTGTENNNSGSNSGTSTGNNSSTDTSSGSGTTTGTGTSKTTSELLKEGLSVSNNTVTLKISENGVEKVYTLPTAGVAAIDKVGVDTNNTIWIKYVNGQIDLWNYDLQKSDSPVKLYTLTKTGTALVFDSNGFVTGYYVTGKSAMQKVLTQSAFNTKFMTTATTTTSHYLKYSCVTGTVQKNLRDSNHKVIDKLKFNAKTGKGSYKGKSYKKVKHMFFTKKGQVAICYKSGKCIVVNSKNKVQRTIKSVKKFKQDRGFATHAIKKNGKKVKL